MREFDLMEMPFNGAEGEKRKKGLEEFFRWHKSSL
jgi:hypothetical protein